MNPTFRALRTVLGRLGAAFNARRPLAQSPTPPFGAVGVAFNVATLLFAVPVYDRLYASPGTLALLRLILLVQVVPTLGLLLIGRLVSGGFAAPRRSRLYWTAWLIAALLSALHLAQVKMAPNLLTNLLGEALVLKFGIAVAVLAVLLALVYLGGRRLLPFFGSLAPVFALACAAFFLKIAVLDAAPTSAPVALASAAAPRQDAVFVLVFDELGRDVLLKGGEIDGAKFPHLAQLAAESVWFADATTNYGETCRAMPSLIVSRFASGSVEHLRDQCMDYFLMSGDANLLVTLAQFYKVSVYEEYFRDCRSSSRYTCRGIPYLIATDPQVTLVDHLIPDAVRKGVVGDWLGEPIHRHSSVLFGEFLAGITGADAAGRVYFLHSLWPHFPYAYDARGRYHHSPYQQFRGDPAYDARVSTNYEQQAMLVDALVGQFVDKLKAERLYDTATIVLTSDHGPHGQDPPSSFVRSRYGEGANPHANVPLLLRRPGLPAGVSRIDYQHVDFVPTVLDLLGVPSAGQRDGVSAFQADRPLREKRFSAGSSTYVRRPGQRNWEALQEGAVRR